MPPTIPGRSNPFSPRLLMCSKRLADPPRGPVAAAQQPEGMDTAQEEPSSPLTGQSRGLFPPQPRLSSPVLTLCIPEARTGAANGTKGTESSGPFALFLTPFRYELAGRPEERAAHGLGLLFGQFQAAAWDRVGNCSCGCVGMASGTRKAPPISKQAGCPLLFQAVQPDDASIRLGGGFSSGAAKSIKGRPTLKLVAGEQQQAEAKSPQASTGDSWASMLQPASQQLLVSVGKGESCCRPPASRRKCSCPFQASPTALSPEERRQRLQSALSTPTAHGDAIWDRMDVRP